MECRLVIGDDWQQVVLNPETDHEKKILSTVAEGFSRLTSYSATVVFGSYFADRCAGGWYREFERSNSLMVVLEKQKQPEVGP